MFDINSVGSFIKGLMMSKSSTIKNEIPSISDYQQLIETIAHVEHNRVVKTQMIDIQELISIGSLAVQIILTKHSVDSVNKSYIATAIKWAIRNELRRRYKWYSHRSSRTIMANTDKQELREAVYETILSIDAPNEDEIPIQIKDDAVSPDQSVELIELKKAIQKSILLLPERERLIIESRFYKDMKLKDLSEKFNISQSRLCRIIQSSLNTIKDILQEQGLVE